MVRFQVPCILFSCFKNYWHIKYKYSSFAIFEVGIRNFKIFQMAYKVAFSIRMLTKLMVLALLLFSCNKFSSNKGISKTNKNGDASLNLSDSLIVYKSETLQIQKLSNHIYKHTSFLTTDDFGKVACNGMLVINQSEAVVFDTPTDVPSSTELINFISKDLNGLIVAMIPTHFHDDCVGGLKSFNDNNIPVYASHKTIELLELDENESKTMKGFTDQLTLNVGGVEVLAQYFGEGHTIDNIIGWVPAEKAIFGGCLIKELHASKGYLGDANTHEWSTTVKKIKVNFPNAKIIIPGHGNWGGIELLDYTIQLFE